MSAKLKMTFQPRTLQHLGIKMYSQVPVAIAELVANSYDADATTVQIKLYDKKDKMIVIKDDGCGMTFDDINDKFLQVGRNRRENGDTKTPSGRFPSGKKGIGKLALFGLGETITIYTKNKKSVSTGFRMNWREIKKTAGEYEPTLIDGSDIKRKIDTQGTWIIVSGLKRKSNFNQKEIVSSLSKLFVYFDAEFKVSVSVNKNKPTKISNKSKFENLEIQFSWGEFSTYSSGAYAKKNNITGTIVTTEKPLKPGLRGIALYARGRLVNMPEFYGNADSSHFYAYATGILNVDFIDEYSGDDDLISTHRQALNWEHEATLELKSFLQNLLFYIQKKWREKRKEIAKDKIKPTPDFDYNRWIATLPQDKADIITDLLDTKMEDNDSASRKDIVYALHGIAPEYAAFHWRYLHSKIKDSEVIDRLYKQKNYYQALTEALKLYTTHVREISKSEAKTDYGLMGEVFKRGENQGEIQLTTKTTEIECDIEQGHADLSRGVVSGFRNPLAHELESNLRISKLITEEDCLNTLSLLSHLFSRLDRRVSPARNS